MSDSSKNPENLSPSDSAIRALIDASASNESVDGSIPLPPEMAKRRKEWADFVSQQADKKPKGRDDR